MSAAQCYCFAYLFEDLCMDICMRILQSALVVVSSCRPAGHGSGGRQYDSITELTNILPYLTLP